MRLLMAPNNSIKYLQRNGIENIARDKKKSNEMKWNVAINMYRNLTVEIHNDSINEFHRLDEMKFMSIEWEIVTDVFFLFFFFCLTVSQSVSQSWSVLSSATQLLCQKCSNKKLYKQLWTDFFFFFLTCDLKSNAIMVCYMDYSHSIKLDRFGTLKLPAMKCIWTSLYTMHLHIHSGHWRVKSKQRKHFSITLLRLLLLWKRDNFYV